MPRGTRQRSGGRGTGTACRPPGKARPTRGRRFLGLVALLVLAAGMLTAWTNRSEATPHSTLPAISSPAASPAGGRHGPRAAATPAATPAPPSPAATPRGRDAGMAGALDALLADQPGIYGVVVASPDGTIRYSRNGDVPFITASLYKLLVCADVYDLAGRGALDLGEGLVLQPAYFPDPDDFPDSYYPDPEMVGATITVQDAVYAALAYSSNVAALALLDRVGIESVRETAARLGMTGTHFAVSPADLADWPPAAGRDGSPALTDEAVQFVDGWAAEYGYADITTARDIAHFFSLLLRDQIVSRQASTAMLDILKQQAVDDRFPVLLPPHTVLAHKTGNLDQIAHDAGIIYAPDGPIILAALSADWPDADRATQVIQRLAYVAYGHNDWPPFVASPPPDEASPPEQSAPPAAYDTATDASSEATASGEDDGAPASTAPLAPDDDGA